VNVGVLTGGGEANVCGPEVRKNMAWKSGHDKGNNLPESKPRKKKRVTTRNSRTKKGAAGVEEKIAKI